MAWAAKGNGAGYFLTLTVIDRNADDATLTYELRSADMTAALADALNIIGDFIAVSDALPVAYAVAQRFVEDAIVIPTVGEMQIKARVGVRLANGQGNETLDIPAPKENIFMTPTGKGNNIVNVAFGALITYVSNFYTAGIAFFSDGEAVDAMTEGRKVSSKTGMRAR